VIERGTALLENQELGQLRKKEEHRVNNGGGYGSTSWKLLGGDERKETYYEESRAQKRKGLARKGKGTYSNGENKKIDTKSVPGGGETTVRCTEDKNEGASLETEEPRLLWKSSFRSGGENVSALD